MSQSNLTEDLNIVANSNLEITYMDGDLNIIQALDDEPNDVGGLTSAELKAKFDEGPNKIKEYINGTLIPEILTEEATEAARAAAEAQREANEKQRIENENARIAAEQDRVSETTGIVAQATEQAEAAAESARLAAQAILGQIVDGSLTEEKLESEVQAAINRAKVGGEIDTLLAGKAPAGYGLGTDSTKITDFNAALTNGFFRSESDSVNGPFDGFIGLVFVHSSYAGATHMVRQDAYRRLSGCPEHYVRYCIAGTWKEWEYENPPMLLGTEYRTTERYNGKPVYAKLVDCGAGPNATRKTVSAGISNVDRAVSANGSWGNMSIPYEWFSGDASGAQAITITLNDTYIDIASTVNYSARTIYALIKYTKTTD